MKHHCAWHCLSAKSDGYVAQCRLHTRSSAYAESCGYNGLFGSTKGYQPNNTHVLLVLAQGA